MLTTVVLRRITVDLLDDAMNSPAMIGTLRLLGRSANRTLDDERQRAEREGVLPPRQRAFSASNELDAPFVSDAIVPSWASWSGA